MSYYSDASAALASVGQPRSGSGGTPTTTVCSDQGAFAHHHIYGMGAGASVSDVALLKQQILALAAAIDAL